MTAARRRVPVRVDGEVLTVKRAGGYTHLTIVADGLAQLCRPGDFVMLAAGGPHSASVLRRPLWVHRARASGAYGGTVEVVFAVRGPGTDQLARTRQGDPLDLLGPLGRPFALPQEPVVCTLVGDGHGAAPMFYLAERLRMRECAVHILLGAASEPWLLGVLEARRAAKSVTVTTLDGSVGIHGDPTGPLPDLLERTESAVVYAAGPVDTLAGVARVAAEYGAWSQCAVETPMACGTGLCHTCTVPVVGRDGVRRPARGCVEGPVLPGDRVCWSDLVCDR